MKLTSKQRDYLQGLCDQLERFEGRGITNATMSALERRGYTKIEVKPNPEGWTDYLWRITDAGRSAISG